MHREIKTLSELSLDGKGTYGIAASAVPYSNDLYTYSLFLRILLLFKISI